MSFQEMFLHWQLHLCLVINRLAVYRDFVHIFIPW